MSEHLLQITVTADMQKRIDRAADKHGMTKRALVTRILEGALPTWEQAKPVGEK